MPLLSTPRADPINQPRSAWEYYLEITGIQDYEREHEWQDLVDVILVFVRPPKQYPPQLTAPTISAALFASFLSTFLVQTLSLLQQDLLDAIPDIFLHQTRIMQNSTSDLYVAPVFSPPSYAVAVNALFFASLGVVLVAAFLCIVVKGWIRELDRKLRGTPDLQERAVIKELREQGVVRRRLPELITILPSLIHLSLVLDPPFPRPFLHWTGLVLLQVHKLQAFVAISIFGLGVLLSQDPLGGFLVWSPCLTLDKKEIAVRGSGKGLFWAEEGSLRAV